MAYTPEQARAAALQVLPDILHYDGTKPATYPNGSVPTDVYSLRFAWLTNGKVRPAGLKPHDDLLAHFPYLGPPNPYPPRRLLRAGDVVDPVSQPGGPPENQNPELTRARRRTGNRRDEGETVPARHCRWLRRRSPWNTSST